MRLYNDPPEVYERVDMEIHKSALHSDFKFEMEYLQPIILPEV